MLQYVPSSLMADGTIYDGNSTKQEIDKSTTWDIFYSSDFNINIRVMYLFKYLVMDVF